MDLIEKIAHFCGVPIESARELINRAPNSYRMYEIKKKRGGTRLIFHPSKETKLLQYACLELYLRSLPISQHAFAYVKGLSSPLRMNATLHAKYNFTVHLDFKNFFPSITPDDLFLVLQRSHILEHTDILTREILKNILFIRQKGAFSLTIGSPASPQISNAVMKRLDDAMSQLAVSIDEQSAFSRYADDITFSSVSRNNVERFVEGVSVLLSATNSPHLSLNESKTYFSSLGVKRKITGLIITNEKKVVVPRETKRMLRAKIHQLTQGHEFEKKELERINGLISFIRDNEPLYLNNLIEKYGFSFFKKLRRTQ